MPEASELSALQRLVAAPAAPPRYNTEVVRSAWSAVQRRRRDEERSVARSVGPESMAVESEDPLSYGWIDQLWTDHIIVRNGEGQDQAVRVPYTVEGSGGSAEDVKFGTPERVRMAYVAASRSDLDVVLAAAAERSGDLLALGGAPPKGKGFSFPPKGKGSTPPSTGASPTPSIKTLQDLNSAIAAYSKAKPADRAKLKAHLLSEAKRLKAPPQVVLRIKALGGAGPKDSASSPKLPFKSQSKVAASHAAEDVLELARRVRSMDGARRYRKPIGSPLGDGTAGRVASATGAAANPRADALRKDIKGLAARDKTYRGGKVFGDIGSQGKLKQALASIEKLPEGKVGAAAAEIVLAAQSLGLTSLVPAKVKRLYRAYLAQKPKKSGDKKE